MATRDYHDDTPQVAEMKAEMRRGPLINPPTAMSDQAIRAHALECASRVYTGSKLATEKDVLSTTIDFEAYIRDGVT